MDQIARVAGATQTLVLLNQGVLHIWPNGGLPNFPTVALSAETGMRGYPAFTPTGIEVSCEWNAAILFGATANVQSIVPTASGTWQMLARVRTAYLGKVVEARQNGAVEGAGTVDVQPLAGQLDGAGNVITHGLIHGVPYLRLAGGANAVILDPQRGDIGPLAVCERDCSSIIANAGAAAPGSLRKHDLSDSVYVTTVLGATPQQYVAFTPDGIDIISPARIRPAAPTIVLQADNEIGLTAGNGIMDSAPAIELDGAVTQADDPQGGGAKRVGPLTVQQDVTAAGTSVRGHSHRDSEGGTTSPPL